ncbi:uncharacterized protein N7479_010938 [Penicillium vulpinum]|uniref:uncharacterized protein n=1 Tax=Penicillium vulpinum TaxID=29845 RepID=UPI0025486B91|nr:uncharacterized protein N7479_010938 [Penicillium vulpinum]KAJ5952525.1 hypothetical protein N7479_010938 [Penicillium vulpinum]
MSSCDYSCSAKTPPLSPDSDITGIGIVINYVVTASIAVLVILVYYLGIYEPNHDPFDRGGQVDNSFRPNPVDDFFLYGARWLPKRILRWPLKSRRRSPRFRIRLQQTFIKCLLAMSDLQVVIGFSILISGFVQLRCGLSAYHWLFIVKLAWSSSLTHLSCLTVLRGHLYRFSGERLWRLLAMGGLATFLVVGLLSTGNIWWSNPISDMDIGSPAICHMGVFSSSQTDDLTFWSALVSAILTIIAFVSRVIKLYRPLSVGVFSRGRAWLSVRARRILRIVFVWACKERHPHSLRRSICYRPLLAILLTTGLVCDVWSSVLFEVIWLLIAFAWGIWQLVNNLNQLGSLVGDWTFGQVVAVVLLAAPLITMMQYFNEDTAYSPAAGLENDSDQPLYESQATHPLITMSIDEELPDLESPDGDWNSYSGTLITGLSYAASSFLMWSAIVLFVSRQSTPLKGIRTLLYAFPFVFIGLYGVVLFSLLIKAVLFPRKLWLMSLLTYVQLNLFLNAPFLPFREFGYEFSPLSYTPSIYAQITAVGLYITVAVAYRLFYR